MCMRPKSLMARYFGQILLFGEFMSEISPVIVNKAEWLGRPANIKGANKGAKI